MSRLEFLSFRFAMAFWCLVWLATSDIRAGWCILACVIVMPVAQ